MKKLVENNMILKTISRVVDTSAEKIYPER